MRYTAILHRIIWKTSEDDFEDAFEDEDTDDEEDDDFFVDEGEN